MASPDIFPFYRKDIPDDVWIVLNDRYVVDVIGGFSPIRYRVRRKDNNEVVWTTDDSKSLMSFYQEKATEFQKELEKIILG
jgi:hypothetical protein